MEALLPVKTSQSRHFVICLFKIILRRMKKLFEIPKDELKRFEAKFPDENLVKITSKIISTEDELSCVVITQIFLERIVNKLFELKMQGNFWKNSKLTWNYRTQILALNQLGVIDDHKAILLNNYQSLRNKFAHKDYKITEMDIKQIATNEELNKTEMLNLASLSLIYVTFGLESELIDYFSPTLGNERKIQLKNDR